MSQTHWMSEKTLTLAQRCPKNAECCSKMCTMLHPSTCLCAHPAFDLPNMVHTLKTSRQLPELEWTSRWEQWISLYNRLLTIVVIHLSGENISPIDSQWQQWNGTVWLWLVERERNTNIEQMTRWVSWYVLGHEVRTLTLLLLAQNMCPYINIYIYTYTHHSGKLLWFPINHHLWW